MFKKILLYMVSLLTISLIGCSDDNLSKETVEETTIPLEQSLSDEEKNSLYGELLTYDGEINAFNHYEKYKDMTYMLIIPATSQVYLYGGDIPGVIEGKYDGTNLEFHRTKYNRKLTPSKFGYEAVKDSKHTEDYKKLSWGLGSAPASILKKKCLWIVDRTEYEKRLSNIGRIVEFGSYEQDGNSTNGAEPIRWVELSNDEKKRVLLSVYLLEYKEFNNKIVADLTSWETCTLRKYLNNDFLNSAFSDSEISYMKKNIYGDYVCIPNESEIDMCFDKESRQALPSYYYQDNYFGYAGDIEYEEYWLRRDNANSDFAPVIRPESDSYSTLRSNEPTGVRPLIIVDSNCNLNEVTY